jgi:hypothetical protein
MTDETRQMVATGCGVAVMAVLAVVVLSVAGGALLAPYMGDAMKDTVGAAGEGRAFGDGNTGDDCVRESLARSALCEDDFGCIVAEGAFVQECVLVADSERLCDGLVNPPAWAEARCEVESREEELSCTQPLERAANTCLIRFMVPE